MFNVREIEKYRVRMAEPLLEDGSNALTDKDKMYLITLLFEAYDEMYKALMSVAAEARKPFEAET